MTHRKDRISDGGRLKIARYFAPPMERWSLVSYPWTTIGPRDLLAGWNTEVTFSAFQVVLF